MHYQNLWVHLAGIIGFLSVIGNIAVMVSVIYLALTVPKFLRQIEQRLARIEDRVERKHTENITPY